MNEQTFTGDIALSVAIAAHAGTSFSPERRGQSEVSEYCSHLAQAYETLRKHAEKGGTLAQLEEEFARYRANYRKRTLALLRSKSGCISSMIAGPSNFPVRRAEKRNQIAHKRLEELCAFTEYGLRAAVRNLRPDLRPIMAGDADALERLARELSKAEILQKRMKEANAAIRKHAKAGQDAQVRALVEQGFTESQAAKLLTPDFCKRIGFPDYALTNNNANIRRIRGRIEQIERARATPDTEKTNEETGITLSDCPAENRIRLTFPGKPSEEIRTKLKSNGFRWAPSLGVWQAYRNYRSMTLAREIAG